MVTRTERDAAADMISYRLTDTLYDWMTREKRNLDGFIDHPEGHVEYSPFLDMDFAQLRIRSGQLGQVGQMLYAVSAFKRGEENFTRAMHDFAFDHIPATIWNRLLEWVTKRLLEMELYFEKAKIEPPLPIPEYKGLVTFNSEKYEEELRMYGAGKVGLELVIEYLTQPLPKE